MPPADQDLSFPPPPQATFASFPSPRPKRLKPRWPWALTPAGWAYLGLTLFVYLAMTSSGINLLYFFFGVMAGALAVSALVADLSLRRLHFTRDFSEHVVAGEPTDIVYALTSTKRYWPTMGLRFRELNPGLLESPSGFVFHVPAGPEGARPIRLSAQLTPRSRGALKLDRIEVSTAFPFGILRRTRRLHMPQEMLVYPRIGMLNRHLALEYRESVEAGAMTSNRRGGHDEFYGVREYRPGDNIRAIHWRSTARRGQLMIREMAANAPPQLIIVLNLRAWQRPASPGLTNSTTSDPRLPAERAIELAATLVCYGFLENFAVGLAIAGIHSPDGRPPAPQMGHEARARLLRQLAMIDLDQIQPDLGIDFPNRIAGRAEWVVITLHAADNTRDLLPPGNPAHPAAGTGAGSGGGGGGGGGGGHRTFLALDASDAANWVRHVSPQDTLRILRQRSGPQVPPEAVLPADLAPRPPRPATGGQRLV